MVKKIGLAAVLLLMMLSIMGCVGNKGEDGATTPPAEPPAAEATKAALPEETDKAAEEIAEKTPEPLGEPVTDTDAISGMAEEIKKNMTLEEKVAQLFLVNFELLDNSQGGYYEFRSMTDAMKESLRSYPVGGVVFFTRNIENREQTIQFIEDVQMNSKIPLFISVDEEGGEVSRIASNPNMQTTVFPDMEWIGANEDEEYAYHMGSTIASEIKELGFNLNFAPVADVRTNEFNTEIGSRSFGDDPKLVSKMVKSVVEGMQEQGISAALKHFPGHGDAGEDTHYGAVNVDNDLNRLRSVDFVPFKAGIKAGVDFIMVSHLSISRITEDTVPASLSPLVNGTILREEMGFKGIIITDAMDMKSITDQYEAGEAAVKAVKAGVDIILMPTDLKDAYESVLEAVKTGDIKESRIDRSVKLILKKKIERGLILSDTDLIP